MKNILKVLRAVLIAGLVAAVPATALAGDRFVKLGADGGELPDSAPEWAMVLDNKTGLYWEVKTDDDSIHSKGASYSYPAVNEEFMARLNEEKFGGFSDWRLPTTSELAVIRLRKKTDEPLIDLDFFPHTMPSKYMSIGWCGSISDYREEAFKFGKIKNEEGKYVMAVRGKPLD